MKSAELLARYCEAGSEEAFGDLVQRNFDFVFSVAKRRLNSAALADEAAQVVFMRLATKKPRLDKDHAVLGWLHRTTLHVAIDLVRAETRRRQREEESMEAAQTDDEQKWSEIVPFLDEALNQLRDEERSLVLLRFFERKAFAELGAAFNISEDAAKMRTSRALDKLRDLLVTRNVCCTAAVLGGLLLNRAVEAAPPGFSGKVLAHRLTASSAREVGWLNAGFGGQFPWRNVAIGAASLLVIGVLLNSAFQKPPDIAGNEHPAKPASPSTKTTEPPHSAFSPNRSSAPAPRKFDPITTRFVLTLRDSQTGAPISGGRMHMAYFYAGGVGEGHQGVSDAEGGVPVPFPNQDGNPGANIFVTAEGYVPRVLSCRGTFPEAYEMKLDPALTFAGLVVDEQGVPVPNARVTMECYAFENDSREAEHVAFNSPDAAAVTDAAGAFRLPYVPREIPPARGDSTEVQLKLDAEGFQVTQTNFPVPIMARHDLKLVIRKGFVVAGRVVDPQGRPVANVAVRELHNFGVRKLRTRTDQDGCFTLAGVFCVPSENEVRVVVEPEDWACQEKRLRLDAPTNVVEFTLVRSPVFRGQVVNEDGFPLAEVTIRTDSDNQGIRKYEWLDVTNIDGYFEWASAPAEPTLFWFEKDGYEVIRERVITPDGTENKITLRRIGSSRNAAYPVGQPKVTYRFYEPGARPER